MPERWSAEAGKLNIDLDNLSLSSQRSGKGPQQSMNQMQQSRQQTPVAPMATSPMSPVGAPGNITLFGKLAVS